MGRYIMLILGAVFALIYIILYVGGSRKYCDIINGVDSNMFFMPDIFVTGVAVIDMFKIKTDNKSSKTRLKYAELFGKQYVDFYCMISTASTISYILMFLPLAFFLGAMSDQIVIAVLLIIVSMLLPMYVSMNIDTKIKEQHDEILLDYPNVLSKMALLINAGMMLREAWKVVGESGTGKLYREMQSVSVQINNGVSEIRAYSELADACKVSEIKKFISIICQNIERGSSELVYILKELSVEAWVTKKSVAKMKGDSASAKLIIPVGITFVGILIMIMVPIVANMNLSM